jgi:hypothetical protein
MRQTPLGHLLVAAKVTNHNEGKRDTMTETTTDPWEDRELYGTGDLARFLGGSEDSFTGLLLVLLQKADPGNVARIRMGFPDVVKAWEAWNAMSPCPTPRQLREALTDAVIRDTRRIVVAGDWHGNADWAVLDLKTMEWDSP